jgi:tRNA(fMet)-specific endonuclease VapC
MIKYLLDTNILIYTIKNRPPMVRELFNRHYGQLAVSSISVGELVYGAEKSAYPERNLADVESMLARVEVLPFDEIAAHHFGQIRAELYRLGTPIGPYDMMLAGQARSAGLILVSNNTKEFERVDGLRLENWVAAH